MWPFGCRDRTKRPDPGDSAARQSDEQAVLDMLVPRAQARIDGQLRDGDALDTKALGVLGVDTAAVALLVAVRDSLNPLWWIPAGGLAVTGILLLAAIWPRTFDLGPDPRNFYEEMGASTRLVATRQMLSELLAAVDENDGQLPAKSRLFKIGFALLLVALLGALTVALVR
jgi:hypothetical protein